MTTRNVFIAILVIALVFAVAVFGGCFKKAHAAPPPWSHAGGNGNGHGHSGEAHGNAPTDHVSAGVIVVTQGDTVEVNLNAKLQGGLVDGHLDIASSSGVRYHAEIDCLAVDDNRAWLSGVITEADAPIVVGSFVSLRLIDNGEGHGIKDQLSIPVPGVAAPCTTYVEFPVFDIIDGNIQVKGHTP